jgi:hypothetical protein
MKYCYNCDHITPGEPLFCNSCGRSYNAKLCPRHHPNPRHAEICSRCGSRDLSTPQPRVPWWAPVAEFLLRVIPGSLLGIVTIVVAVLVIMTILQNPGMIVAGLLLFVPIGILWGMWSELPNWFRSGVSRLLKRRRGGDADGRPR